MQLFSAKYSKELEVKKKKKCSLLIKKSVC